jgi:hypothetical protein
MVDGLDSCEQNKMVQLLDVSHLYGFLGHKLVPILGFFSVKFVLKNFGTSKK